MNDKTGKVLRVVFIVLMGITAAVNILGGVGTTCAAFLTATFPSMNKILPLQWLYQLFVVVTTAIGIAGVVYTVFLAKGKRGAFIPALIVLVAGSVVGIIHIIASRSLRGSAAPADMVTYVNILTLIVGLVILIPRVRSHVHFTKDAQAGKSSGAGIASFAAGAVTLTVPFWVGETHLVQWIDVLRTPILLVGVGLVLAGLLLIVRSAFAAIEPEPEQALSPSK